MRTPEKDQPEKTAESSDDYRKVIPEGERACVWAEAGVVRYKLCNSHFDCNNCTFDIAMRGGDELLPGRMTTPSGRLCAYRFYSRGHLWALVEENAFVRIGIDDLGQKVLGPLEKICLPLKDEKINKKSIRLKVDDSIVPLLPPVEGYVEAVNEDLISRPQLVNESPYDKGWLVLIRPIRLARNLRKMLYGIDARTWFDREVHRLADLISSELAGGSDRQLGMTMPDGGMPDLDALGKLPAAIKKKVLQYCFFKGHSDPV